MNNIITNIDLEYNFNNLRNMIQFNLGQMYRMSSNSYPKADIEGIKKDDKNWWVRYVANNLNSIFDVSISDSDLVFDISTPHMPSALPFVTDYDVFMRYEVVNTDAVSVT